ncbi:hypothetical protein AGMMS49579_17620 [Spirochaetia bacterium]|nr:hypothetical protein AGMMS49579_17620 [Spirochaetia bacterium]
MGVENSKPQQSLVLYHGSKSGIIGAIKPNSREHCDFGRGFYMGDTERQPLTLICAYPKATLYTVRFDLEGLAMLEVPPGIDWAMLVAFSRGKLEKIRNTPLYKKYEGLLAGKDAVRGNIANDRMFYVLDRFFAGDITDTALIECLSTLQLGKQYAALTEKACSHITIVTEQVLSEADRQRIEVESTANRERGIQSANEICKQYRRDGQFFDELLAQGDSI